MNDKPKTELVIFDCDGVLVDSEMISARVLIARLRSVGVNVDFDHFRRNYLGRSWPKVIADVRIHYGLSLDDAFEESYRSELLAAFEKELSATPGVGDVIAGLGVQSCVATSSSPRRVARALALTQLHHYFEGRIFTASQVQNGKPAPDLFLFAAQAMGVATESCLVIEDSAPGMEAARRAGMRVRRYTGGKHFAGLDTSAPNDPDSAGQFSRWDDFFDLEPELRKTGA